MSTKIEIIESLIDIGISLSETTELQDLLDLILQESRRFTDCDAGSLYLKEDDSLRFAASQNDTLGQKFNIYKGQDAQKTVIRLPINKTTIAGYVAATAETLYIDDVYAIDASSPYSFNDSFDQKMGYKTKSMMVMPLTDRSGHVMGVLQLINRMNGTKEVVDFDRSQEKLVRSLASQAAVAVNNSLLTKKLRDAQYDTIFRLGVAAEYRDKETSNHLKRMSNYSLIIARNLGFDEQYQQTLLHAAPMHDVGKLGIPDSILHKPGPLTKDEWDVMKTHPTIGARILGDSDSMLLKLSRNVALSHHEKFNGLGYPNGVSGEEIPLEGRIVAVADVFDALSSKRCYKEAFPLEKVFEMIGKDAGTHFDPKVVDAFFGDRDSILEIFETYSE